ncbi:flavin-containing monooxygenase [Aspergillus lucknowensis]|uniref:L-ornithine N(5)-oxygenase n=1 Tax=Aspergillus lucknowensis TaxID=176173 RepID=A0ABR4LRQ4_9EURO
MVVDTEVLIIGAGLSGVGFAIRLQQEYPQITYQIYEKAEESGGTWWCNTYPGCACDIPSHLYSYSFALNPEWSAQFPPQAEIEAYSRSVAEKYDIPRHITLRSTVQGATWDETSGTWAVRILDQQTGQVYEKRSRILISAVGLLSEPNDCDIPGAQDFNGKLFHSARWDHSFDWAGKDVVVVGNGCSATQFVPILSDGPGKARKVTQFIRQPHWLEERPNPRYPAAVKWIFRNIPFAMRFFRLAIFLIAESYFPLFDDVAGKKARDKRMKAQAAYLKRTAPEKYHDILLPKVELGCKRRVMDTDYLACLHRENMELVHSDPIKSITTTGVRTKSGREIHADAVVLATGFKATQPLFPLEIKGVDGISLTEHWANTPSRAPQAYYGACVSRFPNLFILIGPNTATGHNSVIFTAECQINFTLKVLQPILSSLNPSPSLLSRLNPFARTAPAPDTVAVTPEAEERESKWIDKASSKYVWTSGCASWYLHASGRNTTLYPDSQVKFWLRSVFVPLSRDFVFSVSPEGSGLVDKTK